MHVDDSCVALFRVDAPNMTPISDGFIGAASIRIIMSVGVVICGVGVVVINLKWTWERLGVTSLIKADIVGGSGCVAMMKNRS